MAAGRLRGVGSSLSDSACYVGRQAVRRRRVGAGSSEKSSRPNDDDVLISEHWAVSGFANTDLDMRLKQNGVTHVVSPGMRPNTCIDTTARFAQELGYHVTLVRDAIGAFSWDEMKATLDINAPTYAHSILTTAEFLDALDSGSREKPAGRGRPGPTARGAN